MSNSTKISDKCDIIDIFSVNSNKLVAYSSGLVYGTPSIINQKLSFSPFKYLNIEHSAFEDWWEFIFKVMAYTILDEEQRNFEQNKHTFPEEIVSFTDFLDPKNNTVYQWTAISTQPYLLSIQITAIGLEKTVFSFQPHELVTFIQGFEAIFFKVYLYPPKLYYTIKSTVKHIPIKNIENHDFNDIFMCFKDKLSEEEAFYATEIVLRHNNFMCNWQKVLPILEKLC
jgi:hypothetical protein